MSTTLTKYRLPNTTVTLIIGAIIAVMLAIQSQPGMNPLIFGFVIHTLSVVVTYFFPSSGEPAKGSVWFNILLAAFSLLGWMLANPSEDGATLIFGIPAAIIVTISSALGALIRYLEDAGLRTRIARENS